ncbi:hypothetical protein [Streptomyces africanus]|uniref:hypothetical protein n=1 Tax=Streptomyces africanus TaxID=231024 RepID=UPI000A387931|nr:hypothetical protein [Streptomyces africanus]
MDAAQIIEPGCYDYDIKVQFPSVYIPEHTPPAFRNAAAYETTRTRHVSGQFDLTEHIGRKVLRDHLVRRHCDDLTGVDVQVSRFDLTRVDATGDAR